MDPRVVASPDGAYLAILRDHRLTLFSLDTGKRVAAAEVAGSDLAFAGSHVVVHSRDEHASLVTVLTVPELQVSSCHELGAPTRLLATASAYVLLDRGDQALMIHCGREAAVTPLRPPAAFTRAVGLDAPSFVTFGVRGAERWDAVSRRPEARLRLDLPADTVELGVTNHHASLWIATTEPCLHLSRISDGRPSTLWLDAPPRNLRSHPVPAWVVADVGQRTLAINLVIGDVVPLEDAGAPAVAVAPRRDRDTGAVVVFLDGDALELRLLGGDARPAPRREPVADEPGDEPAEVAAAATPVTGEPVAPAARAASLRDRLHQRPERTEVVSSPALVAPLERRAGANLMERLTRPGARSIGAPVDPLARRPTPPSPAPAPSAAAPTPPAPPAAAPPPASPPPVAAPPAAASPAAAPSAAAPSAASAARPPRSWREALVQWWRDGARPPGPALEGSPLRRLHLQLGLPVATWPMITGLYAGWLAGAGGRGLSIARLAALAGEHEAAWSEALGHGALAALGLVEWRRGRALLTAGFGDYLDGRPPAVAVLIGPAPRRPPPPGLEEVRVSGERAVLRHALARAEELGQVALAPAGGGAPLAQARLEAWLRGVALIVAGDPGPLAMRADEAVIAVVDVSASTDGLSSPTPPSST